MSYQDIKGHNRIISFLKREKRSHRFRGSAYLFCGPEDIGKSKVALEFAKALVCDSEDAVGCDICSGCLMVEKGLHPDVHWVMPEGPGGFIKIEQIKTLRESIALRPYEASAKVYIIKDCHRMNPEASNCLLKTLEEPPAQATLILLSSQPNRLFATIRSRCKILRFTNLDVDTRVSIMTEQLGYAGPEARFASRLANSGIPVSLLSKQMQMDLFDFRDRILNEFFSEGPLLPEGSFLFNISRQKLQFALSVLISFFRDVMVLKSGLPELVINKEIMELIESFASKLSFEHIEPLMNNIADIGFYIERNVNLKLVLNSLKLRFSQIGLSI